MLLEAQEVTDLGWLGKRRGEAHVVERMTAFARRLASQLGRHLERLAATMDQSEHALKLRRAASAQRLVRGLQADHAVRVEYDAHHRPVRSRGECRELHPRAADRSAL